MAEGLMSDRQMAEGMYGVDDLSRVREWLLRSDRGK